MMSQLLATAREMGSQVQELLLPHMSLVRGVVVGLDDYWLQAYSWRYHGYGAYGSGGWQGFSAGPEWPFFHSEFEYDLSYRPPHWAGHAKSRGFDGEIEPTYFLVALREKAIDAEGQLLEGLPDRLDNYPIYYEYRPPCTGLSQWMEPLSHLAQHLGLLEALPGPSPRVSIGRAQPSLTSGTLGGFLRCSRRNTLFMMTCDHVLGRPGSAVYHPGPYEGRPYDQVGEVKYSCFPPQKPAGVFCQPYTYPAVPDGGGGLDVAIAEMDPSAAISPYNQGVATIGHMRGLTQIGPRDIVWFYGKVSGWVKARVKNLCLWYEVEVNGQPHCFTECYEITHPGQVYVNSPICRPGDSGAWIVAQTGDLLHWDGMLFAGDGARGYCSFAEPLLAHCKSHFSSGLALLP